MAKRTEKPIEYTHTFWADQYTQFPEHIEHTGNQRGVLKEYRVAASNITQLDGNDFWNFDNIYYPISPIIPHGF